MQRCRGVQVPGTRILTEASSRFSDIGHLEPCLWQVSVQLRSRCAVQVALWSGAGLCRAPVGLVRRCRLAQALGEPRFSAGQYRTGAVSPRSARRFSRTGGTWSEPGRSVPFRPCQPQPVESWSSAWVGPSRAGLTPYLRCPPSGLAGAALSGALTPVAYEVAWGARRSCALLPQVVDGAAAALKRVVRGGCAAHNNRWAPGQAGAAGEVGGAGGSILQSNGCAMDGFKGTGR